jgi:hypothetical protein
MFDHIIIIRFSVQFTCRNDVVSKEKLFSPARLDLRFELFEKYCLKSLVSQTIKNKVVIVYDKELPLFYFDRLKNLIKEYDFIYLHEWDSEYKLSENHFLQQYIDKSNQYLITTRIDDDDLIESRANEILYQRLHKLNLKENRVFCTGKKNGYFIYNSNNEILISRCTYDTPALFLSLITPITSEQNIFFYDHSRIPNNINIVSLNIIFGILNHNFNLDNTRYSRMKNKWSKNIKKITIEELYSMFKL